jgi:hypothetical protein
MALVTTPINSRIGTALTSRPRLARAAGLLQMRSRENRYGRDRDGTTPPEAGKLMLAARLPGILAPLDRAEARGNR